jgi:MoaA/NifB/PqqE/SkfB family radical SAM enzyme
MNIGDYLRILLPKTIKYMQVYNGALKHEAPITLTFSVTAACQSLCKTCNIGKLYRDNPIRSNEDLTLDEIECVFKSLGPIYFFNISGGEPFLRKDLPQIVDLALRFLKPKIVHIPTNAIAAGKIQRIAREIIDTIQQKAPGTVFTVKPSIDGVGPVHDEIRGVPGNFKQLEKTISVLKPLSDAHSNFHLELGTVISNFNLDYLEEIEDYVHSQGIESYRNEIAEQREEFFNLDDPITPSGLQYERLMKDFKIKIRQNLRNKRHLARVTESFRLVYYDLVGRIMKEKTQVIPCFGGISNVHINYDGEVWPCCVLGYGKPMGNLRDAGLDFQRIWSSSQANDVRKYIKGKNCWCPLANQAYSNILCHPPSLLKVFFEIIRN